MYAIIYKQEGWKSKIIYVEKTYFEARGIYTSDSESTSTNVDDVIFFILCCKTDEANFRWQTQIRLNMGDAR